MSEPAPHECTCGCVLQVTDGVHNEGCCCRVAQEPALLDLPMRSRDFDEPLTIGQYFKGLLLELWVEGERFSGKRPLGNSGWEFDLYAALVRAGRIEGKFDEDECLDDCDTEAGDRLIREAIEGVILASGRAEGECYRCAAGIAGGVPVTPKVVYLCRGCA